MGLDELKAGPTSPLQLARMRNNDLTAATEPSGVSIRSSPPASRHRMIKPGQRARRLRRGAGKAKLTSRGTGRER